MSRIFRNPVIPGFHPDPSICRVGEDYYLAVSSFEYFPGVPLFHSRDLVHWEKIGHALTRPSQLDLRGVAASEGIFAPTLRHHNGRFYMVTTNVRADGRGGNFFVWTDDIRSEWSDPVWIDKDWFDPSLMFDDDGTVYYTRRTEHTIAQARIAIGSGQLLEPLRDIATPFASSDAEGPHLYHIGSFYYLLTAEGGTGPGHRICVGRSDSPWGPFEPCPHNPILCHSGHTSAAIRYTGHGDLIKAADGTWWIVLLATRHWPFSGSNFHHLGRETFLAPVGWVDGWPVVNEGRIIEPEMRVASLPAWHPLPSGPLREDFDCPTLGPEWISLRAPHSTSLAARPGWLRLTGNPDSPDSEGTPAFLARRITEPVFRAATRLEFTPAAPGDKAGLAIYLSGQFHAEVGIRHAPGGAEVFVRRRTGDLSATVFSRPMDGPGAHLEIRGDWQSISFHAEAPPDVSGCLAGAPRKFFTTEIAEGWTGCVTALYTTSSAANPPPADFDFFDRSSILT